MVGPGEVLEGGEGGRGGFAGGLEVGGRGVPGGEGVFGENGEMSAEGGGGLDVRGRFGEVVGW